MGKLTIQDIAAILVEKNGFEKKEAKEFVAHMFAVIQEYLETDHQVKIKGLGTFKKIDVESRESVSVRTGERVVIQGHAKVSFTPDSTMKELVNKPFSQFETVVLNDGVEFDDLKNEVEDDNTENDDIQPASVVELAMGDAEQPVSESAAEANTLITDEPREESLQSVSDSQLVSQNEPEEEDSVKIEPVEEESDKTEPAAEDPDEVESFEKEPIDVESVGETSDKVKPAAEEATIIEFVDEDSHNKDSYSENSHNEESLDEESYSEESFADDSDGDDSTEDEGNNRLWKWLAGLAVVVLLALSSVGGYYYGTLQQKGKSQQVNEPETAQLVDTVAKKVAVENPEERTEALESDSTIAKVPDTVKAKAVAPSSPTDFKVNAVAPSSLTDSKANAVQEESKPKAIPEKPNVESADQYAKKDERVRLGAYRIVGLEREVKVLAGQTFYSICKAHLGPDMECYVEVYNNFPRNPKIKVGQTIKIPKLQLKKRRK